MEKQRPINLFIQLAKLQTVMNRRFDNGLGGISLSEYIILLELHKAKGSKLRRSDLANRVGLTASGITRQLLPMEKIGLISRMADPTDGRASFVVLAPGGKSKLEEANERAELLANDIIQNARPQLVKKMSDAINEFSSQAINS
jgi:DNA-binding MarR family transcriptional regulator